MKGRVVRVLCCLLGLVWTTLGQRHPVPVLCYHGFSSDSVAARGKLTEPYTRFEEFLSFLADQRFATCFADEVKTGACNTDRSVILTFDDGTRDQIRAAAMLERHGFRGVFFVIPRRFAEQRERYFTPADVQELVSKGHRIGVHGFEHQSMPSEPAEIEASSDRARGVLRQIGVPAEHLEHFAFPFGHYDSTALAALSKSYPYLYSVNPGYWDGSSAVIPRMLLTTDEQLSFFENYVTGASKFSPPLRLRTAEGATSDMVEYWGDGEVPPKGLALLSVSPDAGGRLYASYPLNGNVSVRGKTLTIDLKNHLRQYYSPLRRVISYALVIQENGQIHYMSPGHTLWVED